MTTITLLQCDDYSQAEVPVVFIYIGPAAPFAPRPIPVTAKRGGAAPAGLCSGLRPRNAGWVPPRYEEPPPQPGTASGPPAQRGEAPAASLRAVYKREAADGEPGRGAAHSQDPPGPATSPRPVTGEAGGHAFPPPSGGGLARRPGRARGGRFPEPGTEELRRRGGAGAVEGDGKRKGKRGVRACRGPPLGSPPRERGERCQQRQRPSPGTTPRLARRSPSRSGPRWRSIWSCRRHPGHIRERHGEAPLRGLSASPPPLLPPPPWPLPSCPGGWEGSTPAQPARQPGPPPHLPGEGPSPPPAAASYTSSRLRGCPARAGLAAPAAHRHRAAGPLRRGPAGSGVPRPRAQPAGRNLRGPPAARPAPQRQRPQQAPPEPSERSLSPAAHRQSCPPRRGNQSSGKAGGCRCVAVTAPKLQVSGEAETGPLCVSRGRAARAT
ncbi:basic salivary proline-rich protein 4-like [Neopsephotus bourkii]|uniref:basic salivary proline-rich protein 4-like n=1 Tax=Neopsephotus bourkii TaxID=309878 RepID=UPI002AA5D867|nr:basic salivary proline-rich protein 4-like [Neopsephotus bourkii]